MKSLPGSRGSKGGWTACCWTSGFPPCSWRMPLRGFSFMRDGPLDMRMNPSCGASAADFLARASEEDIARVLREYSEERYARRIARGPGVRPANRVCSPAPDSWLPWLQRRFPSIAGKKHPATKTFQALRIHGNRELEEPKQALEQVPGLLAPGGRLAVISFHSLEDRLVKHFIRRESGREPLPSGLPLPEDRRPRPRLLPVGRRQRSGAPDWPPTGGRAAPCFGCERAA